MMNINKWTMALAAAGVVSLSSVAQAQEAAAGADVVAASHRGPAAPPRGPAGSLEPSRSA